MDSDVNSSEDGVKGGDMVPAAMKRSYECTFCKRGFTNAQALGGHMNIHRKDRAKAKQGTATSSVKDYMINMSPRNYPVVEEGERNYGMFFQSPGSNPRQQYGYYDNDYVVHRSLQPSGLGHEEILGANLSLRVGQSHVDENHGRRRNMKEDEVDLELRLGHDP
ncbi:hypothetical protein SLEP1_g427 [Rubroshorea leprosula]|uniref:C2H2-type domain-containing protein n=1 Tax=Rubroshorea leprosula TaxID=152421 RepID=A0AAV5HGB9_9ROSI|nr:hypothetical protein SLEP1_g427 [Rubroshorea leprosula]